MADPQKFDPWQEFTQSEKPVVAKPSTPRIFKKSQPATYDAFSDFVKASEKRGETLPPGQTPIDPIANAKAMEEFKAAHADDNKASTAVPIQSPANITPPVIAAPQPAQPPFSLAGQPGPTTGGQGFSLNPNPTIPTPATAKLKIPAPSPVMPTEESVKTHAAEIARASAALDAQAAKLDADRKKLEAFAGDPKIHARAIEQFNELVDEHTKNRKALDQSNGYLQKDIQILNKSRESPKHENLTSDELALASSGGLALVAAGEAAKGLARKSGEEFQHAAETPLISPQTITEYLTKIPGGGGSWTPGEIDKFINDPRIPKTALQAFTLGTAESAGRILSGYTSPEQLALQFGLGKVGSLFAQTAKDAKVADTAINELNELYNAGIKSGPEVATAYQKARTALLAYKDSYNAAQVARIVSGGVGAGFATEGVKNFNKAQTLEDKLNAAAQVAFGAAGAAGALKVSPELPEILRQPPKEGLGVEFTPPKQLGTEPRPPSKPKAPIAELPEETSPIGRPVKPKAEPQATQPSTASSVPTSAPAASTPAFSPETAAPVGTEPKVYRGTSERRLDLATRHEITDFMNGPVGHSRDEAVYAIAKTRMVGDREPTKDEKENLEAIVRGESPMPPKPQPGEKLSNTIKTEAKAEPKPAQSPEKPSEVPAVKPGLPVASAEPEKVAEQRTAEGRPTEAPTDFSHKRENLSTPEAKPVSGVPEETPTVPPQGAKPPTPTPEAGSLQPVSGGGQAKPKTPKIFQKGKEDPLAAIREHYKPGNVVWVDYWKKYDKVLEFSDTGRFGGGWGVTVIRSDKDGNPSPGAQPRMHSTPPSRGDRVEKAAPAPAPSTEAAPQEVSPKPSTPKIFQKKPVPGNYTLADHVEFAKRLRAGEATADEAREHLEQLIANENAIKGELGAKTLKELAPQGTRGGTKKSIIDQIFSNMLQRHSSDASITWSPTQEKFVDAIRRAVGKQTDEDIAKAAEKRKEYVASTVKALTNPETYDEFQTFISRHKQGEAGLTPEQRVKWDELQALRAKERGQIEKEREAVVQPVKNVPMTMKESFHTKRQEPIWIVQLGERVGPEVFKDLASKAGQLGGNWSSFIKADSGFQFRTKEAAEKFMSLREGSVSRAEEMVAHQEEVKENAADRLHAVAENLKAKAEEKLNADRQTNTARRARMASGAEAEARSDLAMAETINNIADAIQSGEATHLDGVRAKTHIELLDYMLRRAQTEANQKLKRPYKEGQPVEAVDIEHAVYPYPVIHGSDLLKFTGKLEKTKGAMQAAARLRPLAHSAKDGLAYFKNERDIEDLRTLAEKSKGILDKWETERLEDSVTNYDRLQKMGIKDLPSLRAALREFMDFRGKKMEENPITKAERALVGIEIPGYFPTPKTLAERVVQQADIRSGMSVLEPSAGKGNIADAVKDYDPTANLETLEWNHSLRSILQLKGHNVVGEDFLEHKGQYDRIVMNPPFENGQDVDHVRHAYDLLKPGGRIVAIMSEGPFGRSDKKSKDFRDWLDELGGESEKIEGGFKTKEAERTTGVATRIVTIDKPGAPIKAEYFGVPLSKEAAPPIPQHPKYNEFFVLAISNARPGQIVGPLGEMLKGRNIRKLYQDVLDTPIMAMDRPVEQGQEKEMDRGAEFYGASGTYKGKQTIFVNPKHVNEIINTVLEEAAHVLRKSKGRALGKVDVSNFDEAAYKALPSEISAKKMAEYAASIPESPAVSEAPKAKEQEVAPAKPAEVSPSSAPRTPEQEAKIEKVLGEWQAAKSDRVAAQWQLSKRGIYSASAKPLQRKIDEASKKEIAAQERYEALTSQAATPVEPPKTVKQPWEMTRYEWTKTPAAQRLYEKAQQSPKVKAEIENYNKFANFTKEQKDAYAFKVTMQEMGEPHRDAVIAASEEGKPVPPDILAEYVKDAAAPKPAIESGKLAEAMLKYTSDPNKKKEINRLVSKVGTGEITDAEAVRALKYIGGKPNVVRAEDALDSTGTSIDEQRARGQRAIDSAREAQAPPIPMAAPKPAISKLFPKAKPLNMAGQTRPERPAAIPVPAFESLHPNSQKKFNAAWDAKDAKAFEEILYPDNKGLRAEFERRSGVTLPKTLGGTREAIRNYFKSTPLPTVQEVNAAYRPMGSGQPATEPPPKKDLKGFADNLSPMVRGKIQQALDVSVMNQGKPVTRRELIEQKVSAGSTVQTTKDGERRLTAPDGSFLGEDQITKSGMSYADYLANQAATKTEFSLTPPPVGPPAYIEKMADSVWDELDEDEKKEALAEFEHGYQVPVTLLNQANILGLNPEESLQFGNAMRDLLMKPPMEAADFVDEVADKIWADPRQKHDEVFADEMPAKEAAANRVKEFKKSGIRLTEELAASEADRLITEEQQATLLRPMNDQDWEDALDSAVNKRLGRNLTPDEFDGLIKDAKAHVLADGGPGLSRQGVEQAADWLVSQKPELAKPAEHKPESEPEKPKDLKLEWDKKENGVRGSLTLPDGQVVEGHWIDVSQMDRALGNKRSEPGRYTEYIKERIVKQYVRQTDTSKDNALQQKVMDNVRPPGRPLVAATYDASHFTGEFAVEPFVANDFLKYRIVERKAGSDQRWEAAGITIANSYNDALGYMVDSYMGKDGYRFLDPVAREQYEKQYAEVQASEERIRKAEEDRVAVEKEAERAKMEFRKIGKEEEKKPTATEADVITAKPTLTAEASGKPLAQSGLKVPKPKKIVPGINFHKAVIKQSNTFPALQEVRVENGKMISTDLEVAAITPTDLPDGIYRLVGNQWEKGLIDRENMPLVPIDLPGKDGSILLPNFNDLARAERNISLEESRFTMQGALLKIQGGKLDIVATDGHRLSRNTYGVKGVPDGSYIIPRFAILSILRDKADGPVLISFDKEPTLTAGNPMVTLQTGNVKIVTKLLTGSFPKYEAVMPDKVGQVAVIPKDKLTAALKDLKPYIDKRSKLISLRKMDSGHIEITAEDNDRKVKKSVEVPVTYQQGGTAAKTAISVVMPIRNDTRGAFLGLNHDYLTDAVESVSGNSVYIGLQNMRKIDGPSIISGKNPVTKKGDTIFDREKELNQKAEKAPFVTKPLDVTAEWGGDTARIKAEGKVIDNIAVVPTYDVPSEEDAEKGKKPKIVPDSFAIYNVPTGAAVKYHEVMGRDDKIMSFETEIEAKVAAMRMAEAKGYSDNVKRLLAEDPYQEIEELDKPKPKEPKTKPEEPKGGPTLRGSVLGMDVAAQAARIAVEKNVLPILKNANVSLHEILAIAKNWIAPRFGVPTDALDAVMRLIGDRAKAQYLMQETMAGIKKAFSEMPQEDQVDFIDRYKAGEEQVTPELETVAEMYRKSDEERYALKQQYRESLPHKEDHFRVFWKVIPGSQGEKVKLSPGQKVRWKDANNEEWIEGTVQSVNNAAKKVTVKPKDGEPLTLDRNQVFKAGGLGAILGRRPLQGSMGWAKKSTLASISEGLLMGGEPFTYNPQELFEMSVADDMKFITAQEMWSQIGDLGYRKFVREGQAPPEGYARLDDRLARVYFPATVTPKGAKKGFETAYKSGEWYVEENVHRILKNHLSHDLIREKQFGRSLMALKNLTTGIELSLSPFHFFFETYEAMSSEMGLGFSRAWNLGLREARLSELPRALKQIIASPFAPVRFAMTGSAIRSFMKSQASLMPTKDEDVYVPSPEVKERYAKLLREYPYIYDIVTSYFRAGGNLRQHAGMRLQATEGFKQALADEDYLGAIARAFPAFTQLIMKPLFDIYIPNLKVALYARLRASLMEEHADDLGSGKMTQGELDRMALDSVENRFGEMNFDKLFWNRTFKTVLQGLFRSVTWKFGNIGEFSGAAIGQGKEVGKSLGLIGSGGGGTKPPGGSQGSGGSEPPESGDSAAYKQSNFMRIPKLDHRMAWGLGLVITTAVLSEILQYIATGFYNEKKTGKWEPQHVRNWKDVIDPRIGGVDNRGKPNRVQPPTYIRDLLHLIKSPVGYIRSSLSGIIIRSLEALANQNYQHVRITEPEDSYLVKEAKRVGHIFALPFAVQQAWDSKQRGGSKAATIAGFLGFSRAPRDMDFTPAEEMAVGFLQSTGDFGTRSPEQARVQQDVANLIAYGKSEDKRAAIAKIRGMEKRGTLTKRKADLAIKKINSSWLQQLEQRLTLPEKFDVYDVASPEEKAQLWPVIVPETRQGQLARLRQISELPKGVRQRIALRWNEIIKQRPGETPAPEEEAPETEPETRQPKGIYRLFPGAQRQPPAPAESGMER